MYTYMWGRHALVNRFFRKHGQLVGRSQNSVMHWVWTQKRAKRATRATRGMLGAKRRGS